jgi:glycine/D-amino acid oxidase-like deaminating enzyme/nitrite reductase/ring-hydroxylating ferredoxin subunit
LLQVLRGPTEVAGAICAHLSFPGPSRRDADATSRRWLAGPFRRAAVVALRVESTMTYRTESLWRATHQLQRFPHLNGDRGTEVAIVGGGVTGLTAAVLLARSGRRVAIVERDFMGSGETGNTTAHLTEAVDARYQNIVRDFGEANAKLVGESKRAALDRIEAFVRESGVDCGFTRLSGYLYAGRQEDVESLGNELDAARRAGCSVTWVDDVPLPFKAFGAVRWDRQAQVHATAYLDALLQEAARHGVRIYEHTRVVSVDDGEPCRIDTDRGEIHAGSVVVAANVPVNNRVLLHTKLAPYRSYVIAGEVPSAVNGMFWDTDDPYHYIRLHRAGARRWLIVGGEDHRTGEEEETDVRYERLIEYARQRFGMGEATYRWSGQIIEPVDGLPYIGLNTASKHVYVATGYSGNGMTFGTLAGMIVSDLILGVPNPYTQLYDATRIKPMTSAYDYVAENAPFPAHLVVDRLTTLNAQHRPIESLKPGEGAIFSAEDGKLAVCRDREGVLHSVSAICTHLACDVAWNHAEQTWDCPCHGSRFTADGKVINGPAVDDLAWRPVPAPASRQ